MAVPVREIVAHRGYSSRAPENTLRAMELAVDAGADALEWDVHVAACGSPVVFHDANLGRTTNGVGPVRRRTLAQLKSLDAGGWFGPGFSGERIPSLAEALELARGRVARVYTEVKGYRELEDLDRIVEITRGANMLEDTVFISLDWGAVERILGRDPAIRIGYIVDDPARFDAALERAADARGRAFLDLDARLGLEDPARVARAVSAGLDVGAWTVNDPEEAERLARAGVTRFTTNEVDALLAWRASNGEG